MSTSLKGLTVVNTRPVHQAESLSRLISQAGGDTIEFPVIEISPLSKSELLQTQLSALPKTDFAIFVSANAVDAAMMLCGGAEHWPDTITNVSIGRATSVKLDDYGLSQGITAPAPFNSEALLATAELNNIADKCFLIFRGEGGREFLGDTLRSRGASVIYVECYRRLIPDSDPSLLYQCWQKNCNLIIVVTSNEGLRNLTKMVNSDYQQNLLTSPLVLVSKRTEKLASGLGFQKKPALVKTVSNEAIIETIQHWYGTT